MSFLRSLWQLIFRPYYQFTYHEISKTHLRSRRCLRLLIDEHGHTGLINSNIFRLAINIAHANIKRRNTNYGNYETLYRAIGFLFYWGSFISINNRRLVLSIDNLTRDFLPCLVGSIGTGLSLVTAEEKGFSYLCSYREEFPNHRGRIPDFIIRDDVNNVNAIAESKGTIKKRDITVSDLLNGFRQVSSGMSYSGVNNGYLFFSHLSTYSNNINTKVYLVHNSDNKNNLDVKNRHYYEWLRFLSHHEVRTDHEFLDLVSSLLSMKAVSEFKLSPWQFNMLFLTDRYSLNNFLLPIFGINDKAISNNMLDVRKMIPDGCNIIDENRFGVLCADDLDSLCYQHQDGSLIVFLSYDEYKEILKDFN